MNASDKPDKTLDNVFVFLRFTLTVVLITIVLFLLRFVTHDVDPRSSAEYPTSLNPQDFPTDPLPRYGFSFSKTSFRPHQPQVRTPHTISSIQRGSVHFSNVIE